MKSITVILWATLSMLLVAPAFAQEGVDQPSTDQATNRVDAGRKPKVEGWRYKWHNGHWWYYQPDKQWLFWNGLGWSPYSPEAYRGWYANFRATRDGQYASGYRGAASFNNGWYFGPATGVNPDNYNAFAPYNQGAPPGARVGEAIIGGSSGPMAARAARVGENW